MSNLLSIQVDKERVGYIRMKDQKLITSVDHLHILQLSPDGSVMYPLSPQPVPHEFLILHSPLAL